MTNNHNNTKKWIVGIQQQRPSPGRMMGKLFKLSDPGTGEMRDYAKMVSIDGNDSYIAEFQTMSEDFSSFIVGRHIVKDGDIYLINRIDPLFFYLATQSIGGQQNQKAGSINDGSNNGQPKKQSWQPYQQFLEQSRLPREITDCISEEQIQHICMTFDNEELYFKFSADKALKWLQKKQERLLESLVRQDQRRKTANNKKTANRLDSDGPMGGSVSSNFNFGSKPAAATTPATTTNTTSPSEKDNTKLLRMQSLQIICNYLNQDWSKKFVEHLGCTMEEVTNSGTKQTRKSSVVSPEVDKSRKSISMQQEEARNTVTANKKKVIASTRTVGNKRLAKVSTKGMRSIGSFFGAPKAKKPKH